MHSSRRVKGKLVELQKNALSYYQSADEALQIYNGNDVALIFANFGQQQLKLMKNAGAPIAYVVPKEGAFGLARYLGAQQRGEEPEVAEKWVNFVIQQKISDELTKRNGFGNTVTQLPALAARQTGLSVAGRELPKAQRSLERGEGGGTVAVDNP